MMNSDAKAAAKQRELVRLLRTMAEPPAPDWQAEREARDQRHDGPTRAGWITTHEPEQRRYSVVGTVDGVPMTGPFVGHYWHSRKERSAFDLGDAVWAAIGSARRITGEGHTQVMLHGESRWVGPQG